MEQVEVTYVNRINNIDKAPLSDFLRHWVNTSSDFGELEQVDMTLAKIIHSEESKPAGRLHVKIRNAWKDNDRVLVVALTARGFLKRPEDFLDLGHSAIVDGFTALTTKEMHRTWERVQ